MKKLNIIYEDKNIIVVSKEANLLVVSTDKEKEKTLYKEVSDYVKKSNKNAKIFIIHRLDKDTSGVIIFAKSEKIKYLYQNNWDNICQKREYICVVHGIPPKKKDTVISYLKENKFLKVYSTKDTKNGKKAITNYEVIKSNKNYSLLKINIETGRKNQIRVHMHDINTPIVGDKKYGIKDNSRRLLLHANALSIINPLTNKEMVFQSEIPKYFSNFINMK